MANPRKTQLLTAVFSGAALLCVGLGVFAAARSPLFTVQVVEVADLPENAPVDAQTITDLAAVPVGRANLVALDLETIERRILANPWIREARLQKRFPQTLSVSVAFREPRALLQTSQGVLSYVDSEGAIFGRASTQQAGLPILAGPSVEPARVREELKLLAVWNEKMEGAHTTLSSLSWDVEHGYRAMVVYPLGTRVAQEKEVAMAGRGRAFIDLGQEIDASTGPRLERLASVLSYLREKSIAARQIWADSGKKIVVRTVRGS
jgi:cell division protein FtsQ